MNYGIYISGSYVQGRQIMLDNLVSDLNEEEVRCGPCLCEDPDLNGLDVALVHPEDNERCLDKIRRVISAKPDITFYVLTIGKPKREELIGQYPNIKYVNYDTVAEVMAEFLDFMS